MDILEDITTETFELLWIIEGKPTLDVMDYQMINSPNALSELDDMMPYRMLIESLRYIYADGPVTGEPKDDTTRTSLTIFVREDEFTETPNFRLSFRINNRIYRMIDQDFNQIFGLWEFGLMRAD